jgi:peptide/nickel transport system substrate-binding protein
MKKRLNAGPGSALVINRRTSLALLAGLGAQGLFGLGHSAKAETPVKGGHLKIGLNGASSTDSLDPATYTATYMQSDGLQLFSTLTEIDATGVVRPALAERWDAKPTADHWTITLRKGVTFHNGKDMTAVDVVASLNHHRTVDSKSAAKAHFEP